jgi:hypothetical protein
MISHSHDNCLVVTRNDEGIITHCISCNRVVNAVEEDILISEEAGAGPEWIKFTNERNPEPDKEIETQPDIDDVSPEHKPFVIREES